MEKQLSREVRLEERKSKIIEELSVQFSQNEIPMEEYERLVEYINKAESERELVIIEKITRENSLYYKEPGEPKSEPREHPGKRENPGEGKTSFALLSTRHLSGDYLAGRDTSIYNVLGSHIIEISDGDLPRGRTDITVLSLLGDVKIRVPPNVKVRINALPILGEARVVRGGEAYTGNGPELVINGTLILSSIKVKYTRR